MKKKDSGRGKSEFALKSGDKKFMVIELKDQTTDRDKPQKRADVMVDVMVDANMIIVVK